MTGSRLPYMHENVTNVSDVVNEDSSKEQWFVIAVSLGLMLLIIPGNFFVIFYMWKVKKFSSNFSIYAASLAVADFSVGSIALPLEIVISVHPEWFCTIPQCITLNLFDYALASVSIFLLDAIAYDRYKCATTPLLYRARFTKTRPVIISISLWILGFAVWVPYFLAQQLSDVSVVTAPGACPSDFGYFTLGQTILAYFCPMIFLVVVSILLLTSLRKRPFLGQFAVKRQRRVYLIANGQYIRDDNDTARGNKCQETDAKVKRKYQRRKFPIKATPKTRSSKIETGAVSSETGPVILCTGTQSPGIKFSGATPECGFVKETSTFKTQNRKCYKTMSIVIIVFLLCWMPFCITWSIRALCERCIPEFVYRISCFLAYANSTCNPFICVLTNPTFRAEMINYLRRQNPPK